MHSASGATPRGARPRWATNVPSSGKMSFADAVDSSDPVGASEEERVTPSLLARYDSQFVGVALPPPPDDERRVLLVGGSDVT